MRAYSQQSWERLFHFLLVHLILGLVSLSFPFCCIYPALKRSIPSSWFAVAVCCHLIFVCLRQSLLFNVCIHLKAPDARVECMDLCLSCLHAYDAHSLGVRAGAKLLWAHRVHGPILLQGRCVVMLGRE